MANEHNPFDFIRGLSSSTPPTVMDEVGFDLFRCNLVVSMTPNLELADKILSKTNTIQFSRLSKKQQCLSFTSLNGKSLGGQWSLPKKEAKLSQKEYLDKVMFVLGCTRSDAESMISSGHLNKQDIDACYSVLADPPKTPRKKK